MSINTSKVIELIFGLFKKLSTYSKVSLSLNSQTLLEDVAIKNAGAPAYKFAFLQTNFKQAAMNIMDSMKMTKIIEDNSRMSYDYDKMPRIFETVSVEKKTTPQPTVPTPELPQKTNE